MKLTIDGKEFPAARVSEWTFREAQTVERMTGLVPGAVLPEMMRDGSNYYLAFATVGYLRAGKDPEELMDMVVEKVVIDFTDDEEAAEKGPPAEADAGEEKPSRSRRKP